MITESDLLQNAQEAGTQASRAKDKLRETGDQIKQQATDAWDDLTEVVKRHPGKALGIAIATGLGIGIAATALSRRRSSGTSDKLRDLADSGTDAWEKLRSGFSDAICTLRESVDEAAKKLK